MPLYLAVAEHTETACLGRESKQNTSTTQSVSSYHTGYKSRENLGRRTGKIGAERKIGRRTVRNNFSLTSSGLWSKSNCPPQIVTRLSKDRLDHLKQAAAHRSHRYCKHKSWQSQTQSVFKNTDGWTFVHRARDFKDRYKLSLHTACGQANLFPPALW